MKLFIFLVLFLPCGWTKGVKNQMNEHLICGTWQLVKTTNQPDRIVYIHDGSSSLTLNCALKTLQIIENSELVGEGAWTVHEDDSQLIIISNGLEKTIPILMLDEHKLVLSVEGQFMEYEKIND